MLTKKSLQAAALCAGLFCWSRASAQAGNVFNADSPATLNLGAAWTGSVPPGTNDIATWDSRVTVNLTSALGANLAWGGTQILNPAGLITISPGNILTNGPSGIDLSQASSGLTLDCSVALSSNQVWAVTNGQTLTAAGPVSGASVLTLNNGGNDNGTIVLSGTNTYSGGTVINSGTVAINTITAFGTGTVTNNGGLLELVNFVHAGIMVNPFLVTGTSMIDMANQGQSYVFDGPWSGSGTILVTNDTASASTLTFGGASGGNMANFTGSIIVVTNASGTASAGAIRFNNGGSAANTGNAAMSINLGTNSTIVLENRDAATTSVGELTGGPGTTVTGQTSGNGTEVWSIGGKNTSVTFAGAFVNKGSAALTALTKVGTGTFTLTGNSTYTGATTISAGAIQVGDGVTSGNGTLGTGNIANNAMLIFNRPDAISIANIITGAGTLVQAGSNILTLSAQTFDTGPTIITNNGTIQVGTAGALTNNTTLVLGGAGTSGTLDLLGNNVQVSALNSGAGATGGVIGSSGGTPGTLFIVNATSGTSVYNGVIQDTIPSIGGSGTLALTVQNGKLTLGGANTYSGQTTISNGTLALAVGGSISSSTVIALSNSASILDASAVGGFSLPTGYILTGFGAIGGNLSAAGSTIIPGTLGTVGTLTCSNNLSLTGGVSSDFDLSTSTSSGNDQIVVGGTLNLSGVNTIQISPLTGIVGAGTYHLIVASSVSGTTNNLQLAGSPGTGLLAHLSVTATTVDLVVQVTAAPLVWHGDGTLNQWDFVTQNWRSNGTPVLYGDGSFAQFDNTGSTTPAVDITTPVSPASVTVNATVGYTFGSVGGAGKISGTASIIKTNTGSLVLLTPNDFSGGLTIAQGTVQIGNGTVTGSAAGVGPIADSGTLIFDQPDGYEFTNVISGTGTVAQSGTATLTLSGNNNYSGITSINGTGTLQVGDGNTSGTLGTNTVNDNGTLAFNRSDTVTQSGLITGSGALTQLGAGTLVVTASNNFTGGTTISAGTLQLGNGGTNGSVPQTNLVDNGTLAINHSQDESYTNVITGTGGISKQGTNTLTLTAANNYNGNTSISHGTLKIGVAGTIPTGSGDGNVVLNGNASTPAGVLEINGFDTTINGISGSANTFIGEIVNNLGTTTNVLTIGDGDATTTFSGTIADNTNGGSGKIALVKIGAGTITLGNTNSFTGGTIISNGIIAMGNATANNTGGLSAFGPTNNPIVFRGGGLTLFNSGSDNGSTVFTFYNPLIIEPGQTGSITMFERGDLDSTLTGSGVLSLASPGVRGTLVGNWSAFAGTIVAASGQARINNSFGYSNTVWVLTNSADIDTGGDGNPGASGQTVNIGELDGDSTTTIGAGAKPSPNQTWSIGWLNTTSTFAGTITQGVTTGSTGNSVTKVGTGTLILSGNNTYLGPTVISNGILALVDPGLISSSTNINVTAAGILDLSGRSDDTLSLTGLLQGFGLIRGTVATSGGTISPGGSSIGTLTVTNAVQLDSSSTVVMDLNKATTTNDVLSVGATLSYAGTLQLRYTNTLAVGDHFKLFKAGSFSGAFDAISPAIPGNGLAWDTSQLATTGTLLVAQGVPFKIGTVQISGGNITITGSGGAPGGSFNILTSTNVATPLNQWIVNGPFSFDGSGDFTQSLGIDPSQPQLFYTVVTSQ